MSAAVAMPQSTTGFLCMWNGTKDGERGYVDYANGSTNVNEPKKVTITAHNMRTMETKPSLGAQGYELTDHPTALMPYIFRIRQNGTNPSEFGTKSVANASMTAKSLPIAHVDRDRETLSDGIREAFGDEAPELMRRHGRFAQINVWRGIDDRVQKWPLVFINHAQVQGWDYETHMETVLPINDPRVAIRGQKSQDCVLKDDPGYQYHYSSDMTRDEVLVFSSGDSDPTRVVPHGAFWDDSTSEDAPTRRSIEVRAWVFFEDK